MTLPKKRWVTYLLAGVLSTAVNVALFHLFLLSMDYRFANLLTLLFTKLFAFVVNKVFVFQSKTAGLKSLSKEFASFFMGRLVTGLVDYFGLIFLVEVFSLPQKGSKYTLQAVVIVLNYLFAKITFTSAGL